MKQLRLKKSCGALLTFLSLMAMPSAEVAAQPKPLQIGMAKSFLAEQPKGFVDIAADDFKDVMKKTTGLDGVLDSKFDAFMAAARLDGKQLDLAILHAHEFAWVQKKHPALQPLLIAVGKHRMECACVIVHKKSSAKTLADLRGKKLDLPLGTKEHCRLFLTKYCTDKDTKGPASFFSSITKSETQKDALDEVARENVQATVVDLHGLELYKEIRGPVFEKNLRVLQQSEEFPPVVILYKQGALDQAVLNRFRDGMLKAQTIPAGRDMMQTWHIEAFELIPKDYAKSLAEVLKAYPAP